MSERPLLDQFDDYVAGRDDSPDADVQAARQQRLADSLSIVLDSKAGRRFVYWLIGAGGLTKQSFTGEFGSTSFNEGRRSLATEIFAMIAETEPARYAQMLEEAKVDEQNDRAIRDTITHESAAGG